MEELLEGGFLPGDNMGSDEMPPNEICQYELTEAEKALRQEEEEWFLLWDAGLIEEPVPPGSEYGESYEDHAIYFFDEDFVPSSSGEIYAWNEAHS